MKKRSNSEKKKSRRESADGSHQNDDSSTEQEENEIDTPPSFESSVGSESTSASRFRGDGRGRGSANCRLINDHDDGGGKIRPASSRDTVSTTSLSHFDGNSSTGTMSHGNNALGSHHHHHPRGSRRRPPTSSRLFNRQLMILSSSTGTSLVLFLFFYLNFFAFTALMSFAVSTFMLVYTSYAYIIYLIQSGELNIFTLLPQSVRDRLLNSSIHDMFTEPADYMENRFLLLYFIPGLSPEQILQMVNRLPQRHRDLVLGPGGLARIFFPSLAQSSNAIVSGRNISPQIQFADAEVNDHLPLPVIEEGDEEPVEPDDVTNADALRGIFDTARTLMTGESPNEYDQVAEQDMYIATSQDTSQIPDLSWDNVDSHEEEVHVDIQSQASDDSDLGLDINADDMTGNLQEGQLSRIARLVGVRHQQQPDTNSPPRTVTARPRPSDAQPRFSPPPIQEDSNHQQTAEEERNLENEILNDAVSTVVNSYYNMAVQSVTEVASNIVDSVAPSIIRAGTRLSSLSGVGLMGIFSSRLLSEYPVSVMGRAITTRNLSEGRAGRYAVRGLLTTLTLGVVTVGTAYLTRSAIRRQRDTILSDGEDKSSKEGDSKSPKDGDARKREEK